MARNPDDSTVTVRPYREEDREAIVEITLLAFEGVSIDHAIECRHGPIAGLTWRDRKRRDIERDLDLHAADTWVAEVGGRVVAYITSEPNPHTRIGWIPNLAVHPAYQGRGIGRRLLHKVLDHFRSKGMMLAKIETLEHNKRALKLYRELGFEEVVRQVHLVRPLEP